MPITLALNRTCAPHLSLADFITLAQTVGVKAVEIRNDIEGQEFANGMSAAELKARLADAGLKLASVNALQRFNDWTPDRAAEAQALIRYAADLGAPGIVLCPAHLPGDDQHLDAHRRLCDGLAALKPRILAAHHKCVSMICPTFIREGTPSGFNTMSTGVPSSIYGMS